MKKNKIQKLRARYLELLNAEDYSDEFFELGEKLLAMLSRK